MARAIAAQEPTKHLLQDAGTVGGVHFVNDSKATNPAAAIADLSAVDGPVVLIAGGDPKGLDLTEFAEAAASRAEHIIVIGQSGPDIAAAVGDRAPVSSASTLQEAVRMAYKLSRPGWTVLLAPACASFDMFENMSQRGEVFCDAVSELADGTER
jgi:UDP-N-acetylmuramoylalanine--D-glutamate ligase